jgi:hypothetical protein
MKASSYQIIGILTFLIVWSIALILMAMTLDNKIAGQEQQYHVYYDSKQQLLAVTNDTIDEIAREIPGIELQIPSPIPNENSIQIVIPPTMYHPLSSKGIVLLLHACTHTALKFFSSSPSTCPNCVGLSEELRIVRLVIASGYIPVAISSIDRMSGCWSAAPDVVRIEAVLKHSSMSQFIKTTRSDSGRNPTSRVIAIGASSGGAFAAELVTRDIVDSALIMVMSLSNDVVTKLHKSPKPIYLAPMSRDVGTTKRVMKNYHDLESVRKFIILDTSTCDSFPLTTRYLIERVPGMTTDTGNELISLLKNGGYIDVTNNRFIVDPTNSNWRTFISPANTTHWKNEFVLTPGYSPLAKALNRAWAFHEYCSETVIPALEFFETFQLNAFGTKRSDTQLQLMIKAGRPNKFIR